MNTIKNVIFDLGGVLIDWNPAYVYLEVFDGDQKKVQWFFDEICTMDWNENQDAGKIYFQKSLKNLILSNKISGPSLSSDLNIQKLISKYYSSSVSMRRDASILQNLFIIKS